ncbi:HD-GYP domain-containing protein [Parasphingorhabdus sp.]|uniref:HD-GYP domain-containing protein n=1 Tax=Parasphingorhabdus sp. TaxID=2709688 RepID=UPI003A8D4424
MLRKIQTSQLELGMFIHSMEGSWFDHPFWRSRFLLDDQAQIEQILSSDVTRVTIDESRGKKLSPSPKSEALLEPGEAKVYSPKLAKALELSASDRPRSYLRDVTEPVFNRLSPREHAAEVRKATATIKRSRKVVMALFEDARLGKPVKSRKLVPLIEQISRSVNIDPTIILNIARIKTKAEYTYLHSVSVCALMINLARKMGFPEWQMQDIGMAGLLHDIGKMTIPENILSKPGKLDESEWEVIRSHPQRGHDILSASKSLSDIVLEVCLQHHEKMDGTGYPAGISGDELSIFTRMASICDVYDAITSRRPYNDPLSTSEALAEMMSWSGHFDQLIFYDFVESLGILPVGTLVRLDHDELAIVIGESPSNYSAPIVRSFHSLDKDTPIAPKNIDLGSERSRQLIAVEDPIDRGFSDWADFSAALLSNASA